MNKEKQKLADTVAFKAVDSKGSHLHIIYKPSHQDLKNYLFGWHFKETGEEAISVEVLDFADLKKIV